MLAASYFFTMILLKKEPDALWAFSAALVDMTAIFLMGSLIFGMLVRVQ